MVERHDWLAVPGAPGVQARLRRSARARRLSLRVSRLDGKITLTVPPTVGRARAEAFLARKADWLHVALASQPEAERADIGASIPVEWRPRVVVPGPGRGARLGADELAVDPERPVAPQIAGLLKALARDRLAAACDGHSARLGRAYSALALRDTRSRWGSCSSAGRLMFSWRLIMAPPEVLDYVAAHEVAHLAEMNHSQAFWDHVSRLCPDHAGRRAWLRHNGAALHRVRFEA